MLTGYKSLVDCSILTSFITNRICFTPTLYMLQLYKSAGEDVMQLFDLSIIPKKHTADSCHDSSGSLPSLIHRGRSDSMLSLGTLLYRIAHRLSFSMVFVRSMFIRLHSAICYLLILVLLQSSNNRARCARFFQECLSFLDEPDHLVCFL